MIIFRDEGLKINLTCHYVKLYIPNFINRNDKIFIIYIATILINIIYSNKTQVSHKNIICFSIKDSKHTKSIHELIAKYNR